MSYDLLKKEMKNQYAPRRWTLQNIIYKVQGLKLKIFGYNKSSQKFLFYKMMLEVEQVKKHIVIMEVLMDRFRKENDELFISDNTDVQTRQTHTHYGNKNKVKKTGWVPPVKRQPLQTVAKDQA